MVMNINSQFVKTLWVAKYNFKRTHSLFALGNILFGRALFSAFCIVSLYLFGFLLIQ